MGLCDPYQILRRSQAEESESSVRRAGCVHGAEVGSASTEALWMSTVTED